MKAIQLLLLVSSVTLIQVAEGRLRFWSWYGTGHCKDKEPGYYCKDCRTIVECDGQGATEMACSLIDNTKQFCSDPNTGSASCVATTTCLSETYTLAPNCTRAGRFPDTTKCDVYWECPEADSTKTAVFYSCPPGTRFDPKKEVCFKPTTTAACTNFNATTGGLCKGMYFH